MCGNKSGMATFSYEAYTGDGTTVRGTIEATGKGDAVDQLLRRSLKPLSIIPLRDTSSSLWSLDLARHLRPVDVLFLVKNLGTTIRAGMSITESLDMLASDTDRSYVRYVLRRVEASVKTGVPLSKAFEPFTQELPPLFIGLIRAGEASGQLDENLTGLATYLSKEYQLRSEVRSALIYPFILLIASILVVALLLIVVLPRLAASFAQSGVELPIITKIFLGLSSILTYNLWLDIFVVAVGAWLFVYLRRKPLGRRIGAELIERTPVVRELARKVALVRLTRTLGNLIKSGIPLMEALTISADSLGDDSRYAGAIRDAIPMIERGSALSHALAARPDLFPKILVGLVIVGERTGTLSDILVSLSDFYEEEVRTGLKGLTSILEPVLLLIMGLVVGAIALSILLPIYQLVGRVA